MGGERKSSAQRDSAQPDRIWVNADFCYLLQRWIEPEKPADKKVADKAIEVMRQRQNFLQPLGQGDWSGIFSGQLAAALELAATVYDRRTSETYITPSDAA